MNGMDQRKWRVSDRMSQEPAQASFVERVPEAGSCSRVGEMAVVALVSPPNCFPVLSQVVPTFFDASRSGPTLPSLAGKPTAGSCWPSTKRMVHVSRDAGTRGVPGKGKLPHVCLDGRWRAFANPRSVLLAAFSRPLSSCSPMLYRPPLL
jgi:hypothetical protein